MSGKSGAELLDLVDEDGTPTGDVLDRETAHRTGARHRTAHVWLARRRNGQVQLLLQKRSADKDSFPGCWDISSAGHIPAGQDWRASAVRELREELGLSVREDELLLCGVRRFAWDGAFHGRPFHDCQVSAVYLLPRDAEAESFRLQAEEIACVRWADFGECAALAASGGAESCLYTEELELLASYLRRHPETLN